MSKPIIKSDNEIVISREWFQQTVEAIDRRSYACGGIFASANASAALNKLVIELLGSDIEDLRKICP